MDVQWALETKHVYSQADLSYLSYWIIPHIVEKMPSLLNFLTPKIKEKASLFDVHILNIFQLNLVFW